MADLLNDRLKSVAGYDTQKVEEPTPKPTPTPTPQDEVKVEEPTPTPTPTQDADALVTQALERIKALEEQNAALTEASEKWKKFSRQHEAEAKALKRETELKEVLSAHNLPAEAKEFLKGETPEELAVSAEKLVLVFGATTQKAETKPSFVNLLQGVESKASPKASPISGIFSGSGWGND